MYGSAGRDSVCSRLSCPPETCCKLQEQGRKFQTLQDELRSEDLAAAKAHFANIFRKEVVVRGLLDNGGAAGCMCSVFQVGLHAFLLASV